MNEKQNSYSELDKKIKERLSGSRKEVAISSLIFITLIVLASYGDKLIRTIAIVILIIFLITRSIYSSNKRKKQSESSSAKKQ
ncbi:MAG: hypothetical protein JSS63_02410 [Bacteroidetes bacterium]|nr:hypothetical protein [Bacteroidota bacterium]